MGRAEITTVSPGPTDTSRCPSTLISESAERGSPWLPATNRAIPAAGYSATAVEGSVAEGGSRSAPSSSATSTLSTIRLPTKDTERPAAIARSATRWMRGIAVAKHETRTRPGVRAKTSRNAGTTSSSPPVRPRSSTFVLSASSARIPRSPQADSAARSVRSGSGAVGSILKSPLASTTPAGVSIARARLSRTL